jgi:hypothetical protein
VATAEGTKFAQLVEETKRFQFINDQNVWQFRCIIKRNISWRGNSATCRFAVFTSRKPGSILYEHVAKSAVQSVPSSHLFYNWR